MAAELRLVEGSAPAPGVWEPPQLTASQLHWLSRHIKALAEVRMATVLLCNRATSDCQQGGHDTRLLRTACSGSRKANAAKGMHGMQLQHALCQGSTHHTLLHTVPHSAVTPGAWLCS